MPKHPPLYKTCAPGPKVSYWTSVSTLTKGPLPFPENTVTDTKVPWKCSHLPTCEECGYPAILAHLIIS